MLSMQRLDIKALAMTLLMSCLVHVAHAQVSATNMQADSGPFWTDQLHAASLRLAACTGHAADPRTAELSTHKLATADTPGPSVAPSACDTAGQPYDEEMPFRDASGALRLPSGWFSLEQFPAQVGETDDTARLQRGIDALSAGWLETLLAIPQELAPGQPNTPQRRFRNTLFIPRGRYSISRTLVMRAIGIRIVGEHPDTTTIRWVGPAYPGSDPSRDDLGESTAEAPRAWMIRLNGASFAYITRLTLDGQNGAEAAVRVGYNPTGPWTDAFGRPRAPISASTGHRFADLVITRVMRGIWAGLDSPAVGGLSNDAEGFIIRTRFIDVGYGTALHFRQAALLLDGQNTMNWQSWNSTFERCTSGLASKWFSGFNAWNNLFVGSTVADIVVNQEGFYTARGNTSLGSRQFLRTGGPDTTDLNAPPPDAGLGTANVEMHLAIMENTILDPKGHAIDVRNLGGAVILDNRFRSIPDDTGVIPAPIRVPGAFGDPPPNPRMDRTDLLIAGNTFSVSAGQAWLFYPMGRPEGPRLIEFDNTYAVDLRSVGRPSMPAPRSTMPGRQLRTVVPGSDSATIQAVVNALVPYAGQRPMLHIPGGYYVLSQAITIPPGLDIQIIGDGEATQLQWQRRATDDYVFRLSAPARATIRDMHLLGAWNFEGDELSAGTAGGMGILIQSLDDVGGQVYLQQVNMASAAEMYFGGAWRTATRGLVVEGLDHIDVRIDHGGISNTWIGLSVQGGGAGLGTTRGVRWYGGATSGTVQSTYQMTNAGRVVAQAVAQEAGLGIDLRNGSGAFSLFGARYYASMPINPANTNIPADLRHAWDAADRDYNTFNATGFRGNITFWNVIATLPLIRTSGIPGDATLVYHNYYATAGAFDPHGLWPHGWPAVDPNTYAPYDCSLAFQVSGGQALFSTSRAYSLGDVHAWKCADGGNVLDQASFVRAMLADIRGRRLERMTRACSARNTDVHLEFINYNSFESHAAIRIENATFR